MTPSSRALVAVPFLFGLGLLSACAEESDGDADPDNAPSSETRTGLPGTEEGAPLQATDLLTDLDSPWGLLPLEDGSLLIGSRNTGQIRLLPAGDGAALSLVRSLDVRAEGESGLLGLATTRDEGTVFAYYTTDTESRVVAMPWDGVTLGEPTVIVEGIPGGETYHQGGALAVGPDDLLYVATGDNGVPANAQDRDSLSGKVLRYTPDGDPAPGNPFDSAVYSYGHRNVEGLTFDDGGRLWASEFGQNAWDEINLVEAGNNYGWPEVEGTGGGADYVDPRAVWSTADASPSGLAYWDGALWMASLRGQTLWEVPLEGDSAGTPVPHLAQDYGRLRNVVATRDDDHLLLATSNTDGRGDPAQDDDRLLSVSR